MIPIDKNWCKLVTICRSSHASPMKADSRRTSNNSSKKNPRPKPSQPLATPPGTGIAHPKNLEANSSHLNLSHPKPSQPKTALAKSLQAKKNKAQNVSLQKINAKKAKTQKANAQKAKVQEAKAQKANAQKAKASQPKAPLKQRLTQTLKSSLSHLLPLAVLVSIGAIITGSGLLSAQFILAPKSIAWVNDYLPEALQVPLQEWDRPQTLADIKQTLQTADRKVGEIIEFDNHDRLIPVLQTVYNCVAKCDRISEIRIYRPAKANGPKRDQPNYRLVAQLDVGAVQDWIISDSLAQSENGPSETSDEPLPLETYEAMDSPETNTGTWFNLTGKRQQGEYTVTYGQLFHYDVRTSQLIALTSWSSPNSDRPITWQQITGSATPELLIDHSIGLEPHFQAYQVSLRGTPDLSLIALAQSASKNPEASNALQLANVGLWSLAADRLKRLKSSGGNWNSNAQAQLDLIVHHAKLTQDQARQNFSNAHQQVLVKLMDGQWQEALNVLEKDPLIQADVRESFKTETSRLWKRLSVAIEDDPIHPILQAWTAMVMLDRDGPAKTKIWLARQEGSSARSRALGMLAPDLLPPKPKPKLKIELKVESKIEPNAEEKPIAPPDPTTVIPNAKKSPSAIPTSRPY